MGFFRGSLVVIIGVLLFLSLLTMNALATVSSSLSYDNVNNQISPVVNGIEINSNLPIDTSENLNLTKISKDQETKILAYCKTQNATSYNFTYEDYIVNIPCEVAASGPEAIINETISDVVSGIYYTQYDCDFWNCFSDGFPFFLISEKAHDYWKGKFYLMLFLSIALIALLTLFMENRMNSPIVVGILLIVSAIPMLKLSSILSSIIDQPLSYIIGIFFSKTATVFWISFIFGFLLVAMGFGLRLMNLGFMKNLTQKKPSEKTSKPTQQVKKKK